MQADFGSAPPLCPLFDSLHLPVCLGHIYITVPVESSASILFLAFWSRNWSQYEMASTSGGGPFQYPEGDIALSLCPICNFDITNFSEAGKRMHISNCKTKKDEPAEVVDSTADTLVPATSLQCPICSKDLTYHKQPITHYKSCRRKEDLKPAQSTKEARKISEAEIAFQISHGLFSEEDIAVQISQGLTREEAIEYVLEAQSAICSFCTKNISTFNKRGREVHVGKCKAKQANPEGLKKAERNLALQQIVEFSSDTEDLDDSPTAEQIVSKVLFLSL